MLYVTDNIDAAAGADDMARCSAAGDDVAGADDTA